MLQAAGGTLTINPTNAWSNAGTTEVQTGGTLNLMGTFSGLNTFTRSGGTYNVQGTWDLLGGSFDLATTGTLGSLTGTIKNGTLTGPGATLTSSSGTLDGVTIGDSMTSSGALQILNALKLGNGVNFNTGASDIYFASAANSIELAPGATAATLTRTGGYMYGNWGNNGGTVTIDSGVTLQGAGVLSQYYAGTWTNNGIIDGNDANGLTINPDTFVNNGTVKATAGTVNVSASNFAQSGTIELSSGSVFQRTGGFTNNGTLNGLGTIDVGTGNTLFNEGSISPGNTGSPIGTLSIIGNLSFGSTGSRAINIDLNGINPGEYDVLSVSGSADLIKGTLNLTGTGGTGSYPVITAGSLSNTFTTITSSSFTQTPTYTGNTLTLNITGANGSCMICTWDGGGSTNTNWSLAANWGSDLLPAAGATVTIGTGYGTTLYDITSLSLASITANSAIDILNGKALTVTGNANFGSSVNLAGNLTLNGPGSIHTLNLPSGGLLSGSGNLDITNSFTQAGGAITKSGGNLSITQASGALTLGNISTSAGVPGNITVNAAGDLTIAGSMNASGDGGGLVQLTSTGGNVLFSGTGSVTASGAGGKVTVNAQATGKNITSDTTNVVITAQDVILKADSGIHGPPAVNNGIYFLSINASNLDVKNANATTNWPQYAALIGSSSNMTVKDLDADTFAIQVGGSAGVSATNLSVQDGIVAPAWLTLMGNTSVTLNTPVTSSGYATFHAPIVTLNESVSASTVSFTTGTPVTVASGKSVTATDASEWGGIRFTSSTTTPGLTIGSTGSGLVIDPSLLGSSGNTFNAPTFAFDAGTGALAVNAALLSTNLSLKGGSIAIGAPITTTSTLTLDSTGNVTQTGDLHVAGLQLLGANGNHILTNINNTIGTLSGNTGSITLKNTGTLTNTANTVLWGSNSITLSSTAGIGASTSNPFFVITPSLDASSSSGSIWIQGHSSAQPQTISFTADAPGGSIWFNNYGGVTVAPGSRTYSVSAAPSGSVSLTANSPLTVTGSITGGSIMLAANGNTSNDALTLSGATLTVANGGTVSLTGGTVSQSGSTIKDVSNNPITPSLTQTLSSGGGGGGGTTTTPTTTTPPPTTTTPPPPTTTVTPPPPPPTTVAPPPSDTTTITTITTTSPPPPANTEPTTSVQLLPTPVVEAINTSVAVVQEQQQQQMVTATFAVINTTVTGAASVLDNPVTTLTQTTTTATSGEMPLLSPIIPPRIPEIARTSSLPTLTLPGGTIGGATGEFGAVDLGSSRSSSSTATGFGQSSFSSTGASQSGSSSSGSGSPSQSSENSSSGSAPSSSSSQSSENKDEKRQSTRPRVQQCS